jgi:hypothetical protein
LVLQLGVYGAGVAHGAGPALKDGFELVVVGAAIENFGVEVGSGVLDETAEEIFREFRLQIADETSFHSVFVDQGGASAEIDGYDGESFVHGKHEVSGAIDAFAITEGLREELADDDADIFNRVVLVDIEIAFGGEFEIEAAMLCEKLEHVVEEADAGRDLVGAFAFEAKFAADLGFFRVALQLSCSRQ